MRASRDLAGPTHCRNTTRRGATRPAVPAGSDPAAIQLGARVAARRHEEGMTLVQVAERADLSPAYISQIEVGSANPTLATLVRVTDALRTDVGGLLSGAASGLTFQPALRRRPVTPTGVTGRVWDYAAPGSSRLMPRLVAGEAGDHAVDVCHDGEELVTVLTGRYRLRVAEREVELGPGDALHFDGADVHRLEPLTDDATCLVVVGAGS